MHHRSHKSYSVMYTYYNTGEQNEKSHKEAQETLHFSRSNGKALTLSYTAFSI